MANFYRWELRAQFMQIVPAVDSTKVVHQEHPVTTISI